MSLSTAPLSRIDPRTSWSGYLVAAGLAIAAGIALLSPSASGEGGLVTRLLFWVAHVGVALVVLELVQIGLSRWRWFRALTPLVQILSSGAVGAILFAPLALMIERLLSVFGMTVETDPFSIPAMLDEMRVSGGSVTLFWLIINMPRLLLLAEQNRVATLPDLDGAVRVHDSVDVILPRDLPAGVDPETRPDPALVELLSRLPRRLGGDIVAMTAELHYLRVYTTFVNALILMPFGRAVRAFAVISGQTIHRSHWIAYGHVTQVEVRGERMMCLLSNGLELPVSRTYRASLRNALADRGRAAAESAARQLLVRV